MLSASGNMPSSDNNIVRSAISKLGSTLPTDWTVARSDDNGVDVVIEIKSPDGRASRLLIQAKQHVSPRAVRDIVERREPAAQSDPLVVFAPYLSPNTRGRLRASRIGYVDHTGNAYLELSTPGLFVLTHGADVDPSPQQPSRSLRGIKAAQLVRQLVGNKSVPGVRELAERIGTDPGYVSRLLALLDREALVERNERGRVTQVDWQHLLRRWADDAPLESREEVTPYLEPRGLEALLKKLSSLKEGYALSGSIVANRFAPLAPARLATVYADGSRVTPESLNLRSAPSGANVLWIESKDPKLLVEATNHDGLRMVPLSQVVVDLIGSPGRGPSEGEALLSWMGEHEDEWRS